MTRLERIQKALLCAERWGCIKLADRSIVVKALKTFQTQDLEDQALVEEKLQATVKA